MGGVFRRVEGKGHIRNGQEDEFYGRQLKRGNKLWSNEHRNESEKEKG